jgi:hypothetical protein
VTSDPRAQLPLIAAYQCSQRPQLPTPRRGHPATGSSPCAPGWPCLGLAYLLRPQQARTSWIGRAANKARFTARAPARIFGTVMSSFYPRAGSQAHRAHRLLANPQSPSDPEPCRRRGGRARGYRGPRGPRPSRADRERYRRRGDGRRRALARRTLLSMKGRRKRRGGPHLRAVLLDRLRLTEPVTVTHGEIPLGWSTSLRACFGDALSDAAPPAHDVEVRPVPSPQREV